MTESALTPAELPFGNVEKKGTGWWGVWTLVVTEASLFAYLLFSYAYTAVQMGPTYLPRKPPALHLSGPNTIILISSSVALWWGERAMKREGSKGKLLTGLVIAIALGVSFVLIQLKEWASKDYSITSSGYGSDFFTITGFHMAHVVGGLLGLTALLVWTALGYFNERRNTVVSVIAVYWHFVDVVWLCVFTTFYIAPYLG